LFDSCTLHSKSNSYITAASTPEGKRFGYVFRYCKLTADPGVDSVYLGRPWRDYARVVFLYCEMDQHILPAGWQNWADTQRDKTAFYAEFGNFGPGASTAKRVGWSRVLSKKAARRYTPARILSADAPSDAGLASWELVLKSGH
jgi:pectinesterase